MNDLAYNREIGAITDVIIHDFSKAFDIASHQRVLYQFFRLGINTTLVKLNKFCKMVVK